MPALLSLRYGVEQDARELATFAANAFTDTYRELDDPQDIADYVAEHLNAEAIAAVLRHPTCTTLLAESAKGLAGYAVLKLAEPPACIQGLRPIELARFYLGAEFIGQGYGSQLMRAVRSEAQRLGAETIWLGVYERNIRAVRFYERAGFHKVGGKEFVFGGRIYIDPIYSASARDDA